MSWSKQDPRPVEHKLDIVILTRERQGVLLAAYAYVMPDGRVWVETPSGEYVAVPADSEWDGWFWTRAPTPEEV